MSIIVADVPVKLRPDAVQCVLLLLPDEHREALETLLDFLNHVASNAPYNQMTASNLAVCLAPSLFHFNHSNTNVTNRSSSVSPRRRKTVGIPDQRELSENKAAHDCLLYLVKMHRELFMVSGSMPNVQVVREESFIRRRLETAIAIKFEFEIYIYCTHMYTHPRESKRKQVNFFFSWLRQVSSDMLMQCHFNYMEESVPVALEELGSELKQDWRGYLYACTTALLKEAREKYALYSNTSCL